MAYEMVMPYHLHMPSYFLETFTEYPYLRVMLDAKKNRCQLFYSFDNCNFILCGDAYSLKFGDWKGARVGLYSYNTLGIGGKCYFDWFNYDFN